MKIAFDVKGTLDGRKEVEVRFLLKQFYDAGHEIFVWSNSFSYAVDMTEKLKTQYDIVAEPMSKFSTHDGNEMMDLAFEDDTSQTYLAAKEIIFVHQLPEDIKEFAKQLLARK